MPKKLDVILQKDLESLHTGTLMNRRNALLKCEESFELSDQDEIVKHNGIEFKNSLEWKQAYQELKVVLSTRENVSSKLDRRVLRHKKASN